MRSVIALLLLSATVIGGCDRQSQPAQQANETVNAVATPQTGEKADRSHKGEAAPTTGFVDPAGATVTLASFAGKPVLLNLWATWCAPCVKEMPTLDALAVQQAGKIQVVALSQDLGGAEKVTPFFAKAGFKALKPYLDADAVFSTTMALNLPTTILYDSTGHEVWRVTGDLDWTGAEAAALIAEAR